MRRVLCHVAKTKITMGRFVEQPCSTRQTGRMNTSLSNSFEPPRLDGPPVARRRVTRRGPGAPPSAADEVPVLLRIADLTPRHRAAADPVKPEPPSLALAAATDAVADVEEPMTIKFVLPNSEPSAASDTTEAAAATATTEPAKSVASTDSIQTDDETRAPTSASAAHATTTTRPREPLADRRRRREVPPPVEFVKSNESRKSVATQWGVILVLAIVIPVAYYMFMDKSGDQRDDAKTNGDKTPSAHFVPAEAEPVQKATQSGSSVNSQKSNQDQHKNAADPDVPQPTKKPGSDPPAADTNPDPTLDGPRQGSLDRQPVPSQPKRRPAAPIHDVNVPPTDGPIEREARQPAAPSAAPSESPSAYPETNPATYDFAPDNRRAAAPPPESVYEVGAARLNGVQPLPPRDRR